MSNSVASLESTPTWAVAGVSAVLICVALLIEHALHRLTLVRHLSLIHSAVLPLLLFVSFHADMVVRWCLHRQLLERRKRKTLNRALDHVKADPRRLKLARQTSFGERHLKSWSNHHLFLWMVHFSRDCKFEFRKFLRRSVDRDFAVVVGIRSAPETILSIKLTESDL
ncbi:hypothetical protein B296_00022205 [Ensete ventricosum]|uniref:Uncharacterized protein n=1 Tax=Ensete ventricosum TaxID=4639 RepID=A0A427AYQ1_ENSVE|nr:hypothetical protein B296_00022205 [Ensete ventricosum]